LAPTMTLDKKSGRARRRLYPPGSSKNRHVSAVRSRFSLAGVRIWRKATDRTKVEVRRKLWELNRKPTTASGPGGTTRPLMRPMTG